MGKWKISETTEELNLDFMLATYMKSEFYLANSQQAFPGNMELLKSPNIWVGVWVQQISLPSARRVRRVEKLKRILHICLQNYGRCGPTRQRT